MNWNPWGEFTFPPMLQDRLLFPFIVGGEENEAVGQRTITLTLEIRIYECVIQGIFPDCILFVNWKVSSSDGCHILSYLLMCLLKHQFIPYCLDMAFLKEQFT